MAIKIIYLLFTFIRLINCSEISVFGIGIDFLSLPSLNVLGTLIKRGNSNKAADFRESKRLKLFSFNSYIIFKKSVRVTFKFFRFFYFWY